MPVSRPIPVTAFVDWNTQMHTLRQREENLVVLANKTLGSVGRLIGRTLTRIDRMARFNVELRLYHGWHKGFEPTDNRRAVVSVAAATDFVTLSGTTSVSIRPDIAFGDKLLAAVSARLHVRLGIELPNTMRRPDKNEPFEEKMVDTAIASDVVVLAFNEPERWIVVLGDDDDLVPPLYSAEAVRGGRGGRVILIRRQGTPFLKLDGILEPY